MPRFSAEQPATATALLNSLAEAAAAGGAVQERWALWLWDEYHPCVAARYVPGRDTALGGDTWVVIDRPCAWKLAFVCAREQTVLAAGRTSSSAWHQTFLASPANSVLQPSPYAVGPVGSGLELITSGLVIGDPNPSADVTLPFSDASLFWSRGPVVSALFRAGSGKLLGLKLLREADVEGAWAQYRNQSRGVPGVFGSANPGLDLGPSYELYNVGPYNDYVIAVEGCFRGWEVETLVLVTRTGRQLQLGRGGCTHRFREDAPPGGYLAGVEGRSLDPAIVEAAGEMLGLGRTQVAWIRQVKLVWSAPSVAGPPSYSVVEAPRPREAYEPCPEGSFAGCFTPCPGGGYRNESRISAPVVNQELVSTVPIFTARMAPGWAGYCFRWGPGDIDIDYVCPSNACCGRTYGGFDTPPYNNYDYQTCNTTLDACKARCYPAYGACFIPERPLLQFVSSASVRPSVNTPASAVFMVKTDGTLSYIAAMSYCASLTHLGLTWSLVPSQDVLGWAASAVTRPGAHAAISSAGFFWIAQDAAPGPAAGPSCPVAAYGLQYGRDTRAHQFSVYPCASAASVVCGASTAQNMSSPERTTRNASLPWAPGPHGLFVSEVLGAGTFAQRACNFTLAALPLTSYGNGSITEIPAQSAIQHRISTISLSHAVQASNTTDPVTVLTALALRWEGEGAPEPAVAGDVSTGGWETLELEAGETVTSVSGCAGGFLERLSFRTSLGRVWTPAFLASSLCSAPFSLDAPARGYLVGFQPAPSSWVAAEQAASSGDTGGDDNSATTAAAVGGAVAGIVVIAAAALAVVLVRRRRANKAAAKSVDLTGSDLNPDLGQDSGSVGAAGAAGGDVESIPGSRVTLVVAAEQSGLKTVCVTGGTTSATSGTLTPTDLATGPEPAPSPDPFLSTASHIVDVESKLASYIRVLHETHGGNLVGVAPEGGAGSMASHGSTGDPELGTALRQTEAELARFQDQARITCVIGQGASGVVYLGSWRGLRVAVKTLVVHDALLGAQGRLRQRAILEAAISKAMHHPNVVATYAAEVLPLTALAAGQVQANPAGSEGGDGGEQCDVFKLFIIQEFCDVGSLRSCIDATAVGSVAGGGASALCALSLALDVACGMAHIHSQNIVHGDLSSGNVLLSSNTASEGAVGGAEGSALHPLRGLWRPPVVGKVADFGLSVHMGDGQTHASNRFQGTPLYTAPEILLRGHLSPAADVWSYGVLLLELCHGEGIARVRARAGPGAGPATPTAQGAPPPPILQWAAPSPSTPPLLMQLLASCFAPEPSRRPTFAQVCEVLIEVLRLEHGRCSQGAAEPT
ncbi:hypothetical protein HYH03_005165 [Edaphochlamys debaryana]|uniref:Protein kinase domain-containing protein n=1 Tax=Edaphochlamys debaryana TaxID=47281 RepID=A0A835Y682_9CHLO|nr:hypothetical protein HYH03_005165 [Edaphochlamys debaryana]|eukprot:KAG2496756.1 hypothetical protein HYH03_005165 [Edaphochlamys debaryana]